MGKSKAASTSAREVLPRCIRSRAAMRTVFEKRMAEVKDLLELPDSTGVEEAYELLNAKFDEITVCNQEVYTWMLEEDAEEKELADELDGCDKLVKSYFAVRKLCEERLRPEPRPAESTASSGHRRRYKLPQLELKKYSGEPKEWLPFWHQFEKIDGDPELDNGDKIQYLIMATTPGSRARKLVESFPAIGANYEKIVGAMKERFGREELLVEIYIRDLIKLILRNATASKPVGLEVLYDNVEANIRTLETMGIGRAQSAVILYPLIESCLNESLLRAWQRSPRFAALTEGEEDARDAFVQRLEGLMKFLRKEVENEQRISVAVEGLGIGSGRAQRSKDDAKCSPTAAVLHTQQSGPICAFCDGAHVTRNCERADGLSIAEKRLRLQKRGLCFRCAGKGHSSRVCFNKPTCGKCRGRHLSALCDREQALEECPEPREVTHQALASVTTLCVFLQTLRVTAYNGDKQISARVLLDSGAQSSYISEEAARRLNYESTRVVNLKHALFGGMVTEEQTHEAYKVFLRQGRFSCDFEALSQRRICQSVPTIQSGPWIKQAAALNIRLSDVGEESPVEVLIGADIMGRLLTGRVQHMDGGLTAVETHLGWTLMGKTASCHERVDTTATVLNMLVGNNGLKCLWELETLGIEDPAKQRSDEEAAQDAMEHFLGTVRVNDERRYEVALPWLADMPVLPSHEELARGRLEKTIHRLERSHLLGKYNDVFQEWLEEGIIEVAAGSVGGHVHYLPHRPVVKMESETTKIRPVFDASARQGSGASLNDCLEKGVNLIKLIPDILLGFREHTVGATADIRKAFLQISVREEDRDVLRFLWKDANGQVITYRHRRVVFGVNCSPFLLAATILHHLDATLGDDLDGEFGKQLRTGFYVDNCVVSFPSHEEAQQFRQRATSVMAAGGFDLRGWLFTDNDTADERDRKVPVLGLLWDRCRDTLSLSPSCAGMPQLGATKRVMLAQVQRVFDPIGFSSPVTIMAKVMLQELWQSNVGWDEPIGGEVAERFGEWSASVALLTRIAIPRSLGFSEARRVACHVFCDASQAAYAAVIFARVEGPFGVRVGLVAAKSRVAPVKRLTIPRLKLMAATIASRLYATVKEVIPLDEVYFWSDSSTVLAWLRRKEEWAPFVGNRVKEIRQLTEVSRWKHVPGKLNPADLPSRGCTAAQLIETRWWEGPKWLYESEQRWNFSEEAANEGLVGEERRKTAVVCLTGQVLVDEFHLDYFSKHTKSVRMLGWIRRFCDNCRNREATIKGDITYEEYQRAEMTLWQLVQKEVFGNVQCERLKPLSPVVTEDGLFRLQSRICAREDTLGMRYPIVLPGEHKAVKRYIIDTHLRFGHLGAQGLLAELREHFWIVGGRRVVRAVVSQCTICRRHGGKRVEVAYAPLPRERVRDAAVFEVSGVDFAGPLLLRSKEKAWVCLFTCAVYRAVHLELVTSLSSSAFLEALRRFIARRGRPLKIFSDNGTNFVGAARLFAGLNWNRIQCFSNERRIEWVFNPPSAPWWGGFWERMVGLMKRILRKVLGNASLDYEELVTVLCDTESILNSRPLTHLPCSPDEFRALTPHAFLRDLPTDGVPDCDKIDSARLCKRAAYRQTLRDCLRQRFRREYLGQLHLRQKKRTSPSVEVGQVMLMEDDSKKRVEWPLVRIEEVIRGRDGQIRVVRVRTPRGMLTRPVRRLFSLECEATQDDTETDGIVTRGGRVSRKPIRLGYE